MGKQLGWVWFGGKDLLPFYVLIVVDASGSLTPQQVPGVFDAVSLIRNNLVILGTLTEEQKNTFVPYRTYSDEQYLRWFSTAVLEVKPDDASKCVAMAWIDEAEPGYHGYNYDDEDETEEPYFLGGGFVADLNSFVNFINTRSVDLLGAKIFAPPWEVLPLDFFAHLNAAFTSASPPLASFQNIYDEQMLDYIPTVDRSQITTAYAYNLMANYLNGFFQKEGFDLLPLL
jgi:hypothetical protein